MDGGTLPRHFNGPGFVVIVRDITCVFAGISGWWTQIQKEEPNILILGLSMACLGVTGISGGVILKQFFTALVSSQSQSDSSLQSQHSGYQNETHEI